jgi:hypothetical protein
MSAVTAKRWCQPIRRRARATAWLIAALNSVEPFVMQLATIDIFVPARNGRNCAGGRWSR